MNIYYSTDSLESDFFQEKSNNCLEEREKIYDDYRDEDYFDTRLKFRTNLKSLIFSRLPQRSQLIIKRIIAMFGKR